MSDPIYEFHIIVCKWNTYGDKVELQTPTVILAKNKAEVTRKMRAAFGATYDDFRNFWSHDYALQKVHEVTPPIASETP